MKKILIPVFALGLVFATSCKKQFFDINNSPNSPTEASITPKVLLPRILHNIASRTGVNYNTYAGWMGYWAHSGSYGQSAELESYALTANFEAGQWSGWYDILFDVSIMEKQAKALNAPFYIGAAKVCKAIGFMNLVDQYNNVPYSKAFDVAGNITPAYDKGEDIYTDLLAQLDQAAVIFKTTAPTTDADIQSADVVFGGVATPATNETIFWRRLVNTMRIKLLLHMSQLSTTSAKAATVSAAITADGAGFLNAGQNAAVGQGTSPFYLAVAGKQNPYWDSFKITFTGATDAYNRASTYYLSKAAGANGRLGANNPAGSAQIAIDAVDDDNRYQFVFSKAATPLSVPQYGFPAQVPTPVYNYIGAQFGEVVPNNDIYKSPNQSDVAGPGLAKSVAQPQQILTGVESLFLQSEAAARGYIAGDPSALLVSAITESYTFLGAGSPTAYIANRGIVANLALAATPDAKAKVIVFEKYLSLIGLDFLEAYTDYRRLGVPADLPLSLNPARVANVVPVRLQYPQAEFNYNTANVNAQGVIDPQTSTVFWDK
jgi:hypothetical protein